jgi:undecaprenyl-diphosphatase
MLEALKQVDAELLLWLNSHHSLFFDRIMYFVSGRWEWIPLYAVILGFIIYRFKWRAIWILLAVALMITLSDQLANLLKSTIMRPRPCKDPEIGHLVHLVNDYCGGAYGFVSGHAANAFALATFLSLLYRRRWVIAGMMCWAALVSYSRIYLGVHYPGDVLCGALLGTFLAWSIYLILRRIRITGVHSPVSPRRTEGNATS